MPGERALGPSRCEGACPSMTSDGDPRGEEVRAGEVAGEVTGVARATSARGKM